MTRIQKIVSGAVSTALWFALAPLTFAQTTSTTTPGVPNTGVGGDPTTLLTILGLSAVVIVVGGAYLLWEQGHSQP